MTILEPSLVYQATSVSVANVRKNKAIIHIKLHPVKKAKFTYSLTLTYALCLLRIFLAFLMLLLVNAFEK